MCLSDSEPKAYINHEGPHVLFKPAYDIYSKCRHNIITMEGIKSILKLIHANSTYTTINSSFFKYYI